jgi:Cd(II)/Pb(II)-responsive transcriptional regulator
MKIGELAARADTQVETVRYYEREGLLPPAARSDSNYRLYGPAHAQRLAFIRQCRSLDMSLDEIRALLRFVDTPQADCQGVDSLIDAHIGHVAERIRELRQLQGALKELRALCDGSRTVAECGILAAVGVSAAAPARPAQATHRHLSGPHQRRAASRRAGS